MAKSGTDLDQATARANCLNNDGHDDNNQTEAEDKYEINAFLRDDLEQEITGDKYEFPTVTPEINQDISSNKVDNIGPETDKSGKSNKERRRNNRLQSGATAGSKYHNAQRFPGGHGKVNDNREKPAASEIASGEMGPVMQEFCRSAERPRDNSDSWGSDTFVSRETDDFVFFWRQGSPFSQWHLSEFTIDGITFNCAEQYMMYNKARMAKCEPLMAAILNELDPAVQKKYGRQVPKFDYGLWSTLCQDVVKKGSLAKFSQNEGLKEKLLSTYPKTLVEASPHDQIWGIGLSAFDPKAVNKETWNGQNLLGKILTEVRDELLHSSGFLST